MDNLDIVVPITKKENIQCIIDSCMKKNGMNKRHSRTIKVNDYRSPIDGDLTSIQEQQINITSTIEILKYYFNNCIKILENNNCNMSHPVCEYINNFTNFYLTGNDLLRVVNSSIEDINILKDEESLLGNFLNKYLKNSISSEHFNSEILYKDLSIKDNDELLFNGYSKRIYMNLPKHSPITYEFGTIFIKKCIDRGIPFDLKLLGALQGIDEIDGSIIYSKNCYLEEHIKILEEILKENKEYRQFIGSPISTGGNIIEDDNKSYMAISHAGNCINHGSNLKTIGTYNDASDVVINSLYTYSCCKFINDYLAYFISHLDRKTIKEVKQITQKELDKDSIRKLRYLGEDIRKEVFEFISNNPDRKEEFNSKLKLYIEENFSSIVSLVNFGNLNHKDTPMYEDINFELLRKRKKEKQLNDMFKEYENYSEEENIKEL